jgi:hypothetical protein
MKKKNSYFFYTRLHELNGLKNSHELYELTNSYLPVNEEKMVILIPILMVKIWVIPGAEKFVRIHGISDKYFFFLFAKISCNSWPLVF